MGGCGGERVFESVFRADDEGVTRREWNWKRNWNGNWNWNGRVETVILDDGESATAQPPQKTAVGKVDKVGRQGQAGRYSCAGTFS